MYLKYLDCHGVMTPSSGPPISTSVFSLVRPLLNSLLLLDKSSLFTSARTSSRKGKQHFPRRVMAQLTFMIDV
uniref:Uncharacterized protein n=1 Tax=Timema cristinae TaxID=61476 RepID=A0A7R9CB56_TIMCR|nr:unnamed protein product [Timema cristinae]